MANERPAAHSMETPIQGTRQVPQNAIVSERAVQPVAITGSRLGTAVAADRRHGVSDLERASAALAHAVQYLSSEQRAGRCTSVRANRLAITVLCQSAERLTKLENREPARVALKTWLAGGETHLAAGSAHEDAAEVFDPKA